MTRGFAAPAKAEPALWLARLARNWPERYYGKPPMSAWEEVPTSIELRGFVPSQGTLTETQARLFDAFARPLVAADEVDDYCTKHLRSTTAWTAQPSRSGLNCKTNWIRRCGACLPGCVHWTAADHLQSPSCLIGRCLPRALSSVSGGCWCHQCYCFQAAGRS